MLVIKVFIDLFDYNSSDSVIGNSEPVQKTMEEEPEEEDIEEQDESDTGSFLTNYILYQEHQEYQHEKKLKHAQCARCVHLIPERDEETGEEYDKCACDGHIINGAFIEHYCRDFTTC